jgi:hypothetical protein
MWWRDGKRLRGSRAAPYNVYDITKRDKTKTNTAYDDHWCHAVDEWCPGYCRTDDVRLNVRVDMIVTLGHWRNEASVNRRSLEAAGAGSQVKRRRGYDIPGQACHTGKLVWFFVHF